MTNTTDAVTSQLVVAYASLLCLRRLHAASPPTSVRLAPPPAAVRGSRPARPERAKVQLHGHGVVLLQQQHASQSVQIMNLVRDARIRAVLEYAGRVGLAVDLDELDLLVLLCCRRTLRLGCMRCLFVFSKESIKAGVAYVVYVRILLGHNQGSS